MTLFGRPKTVTVSGEACTNIRMYFVSCILRSTYSVPAAATLTQNTLFPRLRYLFSYWPDNIKIASTQSGSRGSTMVLNYPVSTHPLLLLLPFPLRSAVSSRSLRSLPSPRPAGCSSAALSARRPRHSRSALLMRNSGIK